MASEVTPPERHMKLKVLSHSQVLEEGGLACGAGGCVRGALGGILSPAGGGGEDPGQAPSLGSDGEHQRRR